MRKHRFALWPTLLIFILLSHSAAAQNPTVTVSGGEVRGQQSKAGIWVFRGVPYAQPPVGELRWRDPVAAKAWNGVLKADHFRGECAQNPMWGHPRVVNEDCLYLNVWSPDLSPASAKPVMVWIHGGGNVAGSGNEDAENLARHDVVLVTLNYRLGVFGFFAHPALTAESPHHASGNYGLMDQIAALHWVHENIPKFGGDPENVTIFGESAGAVDVNLLMASPQAKGLFRRVIAESGSILLEGGPRPLSAAEQQGVKLAENAGIPFGNGALKALRSASTEQLLDAFAKTFGPGGIPPSLGVVQDGWVLSQSPAALFASGKQIPASLIIGINAREFGGPPDAREVKRQIEARYGKLADQGLPAYGISTSPTGQITQSAPDPLYGNAGSQWMTDIIFRCPTIIVANWNSKVSPTYLYQFERTAPGREAVGAVHASEVVYVFGNLDAPASRRPSYSAADHAISNAMQDYWTDFAKTGTPDGKGVPPWPEYKGDSRQFMRFTDNGPVVGEKLREAQCAVFAEGLIKAEK